MLCQKLLQRAVSFRLVLSQVIGYPLRTDGKPDVRVGDIEVLRLQIGLALDHAVREFIEDAQRFRIADFAVAHIAPVIETLFKHARRRVIALRGKVNNPTLITRYLAAKSFHKHRLCVGTLAEKPEFVDEDPA